MYELKSTVCSGLSYTFVLWNEFFGNEKTRSDVAEVDRINKTRWYVSICCLTANSNDWCPSKVSQNLTQYLSGKMLDSFRIRIYALIMPTWCIKSLLRAFLDLPQNNFYFFNKAPETDFVKVSGILHQGPMYTVETGTRYKWWRHTIPQDIHTYTHTPYSKMAAVSDGLGRVAWKRGIEGFYRSRYAVCLGIAVFQSEKRRFTSKTG